MYGKALPNVPPEPERRKAPAGRADARSPLRWPLAARTTELHLGTAVLAGEGHDTLLIAGPPGVGKSRLADELLRRAERGGARVHRVTASRAAAAVPLGAMAHVIPDGVDMADPVRGFQAVVAVLRGDCEDAAAAEHLILVDDVHLIDAASAVLLRQLLDARCAKIVATARAGEMSDSMAALTTASRTYRMDLELFDEVQLDEMLSAALQGPLSRRTLSHLFRVSGGNALYAREIVLRSLEDEALTYDGELWDLDATRIRTTPRLDELIAGRLAGISKPERELLRLLSLCEPLPLADAEEVATTTGVIRLEEAALLRIEQDPGGPAVALAHPLYGEVLRAGLSRLRTRELLLAQMTRTRRRGDLDRRDTLRLATWSLAATGAADRDLLLGAAMVARHAHDYESVRSLLEAVPVSDRVHAVSLLLGHAAMQLGMHRESDAHLKHAQHTAQDDGELITASLVRTWNLFWMAGQAKRALQVNETAVSRLESAAATRPLILNEGALRTVSGDPIGGLAVLASLDADFTRVSSPAAWSMAAMARTAGLAYTGRVQDAVGAGHHAYQADRRMAELELAQHGTIPEGQLNPVILALGDAGEFARARDTADRVLAAGAATDAALTWAWAAFFRARAEWLAGDVHAARTWYAEALAQARANGYLPVVTGAWYGLAAAAAVLHDPDAAEAALEAARGGPAMGHLAGEESLGEAWLEAAGGRLGPARATLTGAAVRAKASGHACSEAILLTDVARLGGAADVAPRLAELATTVQGEFTSARAQFAGALAAREPEALMRCHERFHAIGANLLASEAASAASAAWSRKGDSRRAVSAAHLAERSAVLCPGVRTPLRTISVHAPSLTLREREIAALAATGVPSKEIAGDLYLSVRTVENHLRRIYDKLGVGTRRELAAALQVVR